MPCQIILFIIKLRLKKEGEIFLNRPVNSFLAILILIITASGVGGSIYYYANSIVSETYVGQYPEDLLGQKKLSEKQTSAEESNCSTCGASKNLSNWKTYTNSNYNFSIKYPDDWLTEEGQDFTKSPAQDYFKFKSPNFEWSNSLDKKIEKGYFVVIRVLPATLQEGYSGEASEFKILKEIKIGNYQALEFVVKDVDDVEELPPAQIKFTADENLVLIDGWFSVKDQDEFLEIFETMAKTFTFI